MHRRNRGFNPIIAVAILILLTATFSAMALAQSDARAVAMFDSAVKQTTSVAGIGILADRPKGFNPLNASSAELGRYGLPQRPDPKANPKAFVHWTKAMQAIQYRAADVQALPFSSTNLKTVKQSPAAAISGAPTQYYSYNWSGAANTNNLKSWNSVSSFNYVQSTFNVPVAQPPLGACKAGINGSVGVPGFYTASWNGIDGFSNGDVIQGGALSYADCGGPSDNVYLGWVEWYPSYPILEIVCGKQQVPCPVRGGDQFFVITYGANSPTQYVFVENVTRGWYGTFALAYITGPSLVGSSAEQIVERPCCDNDGYPLALTNYVANSFDYAWATNGKGDTFGPGQQNAATGVVDMVDDGVTQTISIVNQGSAGFQGLYSLFFESDNCSYQGGCKSQ
jgi:Peptidase A4 family